MNPFLPQPAQCQVSPGETDREIVLRALSEQDDKPVDREEINEVLHRISQSNDRALRDFYQEMVQENLHPIFKRKNWRGLTTAQWVYIYPGLVLASRLLTSPRAVFFFNDFMHGRRTQWICGQTPAPCIDNFGDARPACGRMHSQVFPIEAPTTALQKEAVLQMLNEIAPFVRIRFADLGPHKLGHTWTSEMTEVATGRIFNQMICPVEINRTAIDHLGDSEITLALAVDLTLFPLAVVLVHEIGHVTYGWRQHGSKGTSHSDVKEPSFNGSDGVPEMGLQLERYVFGTYFAEDIRRECRQNFFDKKLWTDLVAETDGEVLHSWTERDEPDDQEDVEMPSIRQER